jgi:phosphatidylserine/phosphatidylglycerophosphate/cardiolipin synthase-like enzyme
MSFICMGSGPFENALVAREHAPNFFPQKAPIRYPFQQIDELNYFEIEPNKILSHLTENRLNALEDFYTTLPFDEKINLYQYVFPTGTSWDFLPYPLIPNGKIDHPETWITHFKNHESKNGIHDLGLQLKLNQLTNSKAYAGNKVQILETPFSLYEIKTQLENATNHVLMSSFLLQCDAGSEPLLKLMEKKIQEGVAIYVMLDKKFTLADKKCPKRLKQIGVNLGLVGDGLTIFHEKMYIFDGERAIIDGHNLLAAQTLSNGTNNLINDRGIAIEGPLVQEIAQRFQYLWEETTGKNFSGYLQKFYQQKEKDAAPFKMEENLKQGLAKNQGVCRLVTNTPSNRSRNIYQTYEEYLELTQHYLFFNFIDMRFGKIGANDFGNRFLAKVIEKVNENPGMRADMITNHWKLPTDVSLPKDLAVKRNWFNYLVTKPGTYLMAPPYKQVSKARQYINSRLDGGDLHWWTSSPYNHSKSIMFDNSVVIIGSYNLNVASEALSYEQAVVCHDQELVKQMQKVIVRDALNSLPMPLNRK